MHQFQAQLRTNFETSLGLKRKKKKKTHESKQTRNETTDKLLNTVSFINLSDDEFERGDDGLKRLRRHGLMGCFGVYEKIKTRKSFY